MIIQYKINYTNKENYKLDEKISELVTIQEREKSEIKKIIREG